MAEGAHLRFHSLVAPWAARRKSCSVNPKGIPASSPRLRGTSYLGCQNPMDHNPNGVVSARISHRTKPRWGLIGSAWLTQGSCATLGGRTKSLRDFSAAPLRHGVFALILLFW